MTENNDTRPSWRDRFSGRKFDTYIGGLLLGYCVKDIAYKPWPLAFRAGLCVGLWAIGFVVFCAKDRHASR